MSRAVSGDHVLFNECISIFRPEIIKVTEGDPSVGYLLLDFDLTEHLVFEHFKIEPSIRVHLPGAYSAFISRVVLPKWFDWSHNTHLFTIGLAAIISFVTGRPVKAPRDGYTSRREELDDYTLNELAVQFPVLTTGPGAHDTMLAKKNIDEFREKIQETVRLLFEIPYEQYIETMQSIRLVQLAHLNKREDFGLGYYLLVSAIEPIATRAISRKSVVNKNEVLTKYKELLKESPEFEGLFVAYQQEFSKNRYIGKRFVAFILKYCPVDQWYGLEHPQKNSSTYFQETFGHGHDWVTEKQWYEIYPEDLQEQEIRAVLNDVYKHRSSFTHEGKNPPHSDPNSHNRFFDKQIVVLSENDSYRVSEIILPNFQLISFIAFQSIVNFLREETTKK